MTRFYSKGTTLLALALFWGASMRAENPAPWRPLPAGPGPNVEDFLLEDSVLFEDKDPITFFKERAQEESNKQCGEDLAALTQDYEKHPDDASIREELVQAIFNCGPCANRYEKSGRWHTLRGTCLLSDDLAKLDFKFSSLKCWLERSEHLPQRKNGFEHMLEFLPVAEVLEKPIEYVGFYPKLAFVALKGQWGPFQEVQRFLVKNTLWESDPNQWALTFEKHATPSHFNFDSVELKDHGTPWTKQVKTAENAKGSWSIRKAPSYLTVQYSMTGTFHFSTPEFVIKNAGQSILRSALFRVSKEVGP